MAALSPLNATDGPEVVNVTGNDTVPIGDKVIWRLVAVGTLLSLISLCAVFGNSLVIISVYRNRKLRTITNCFVVSLALADLLVGLLVLPLGIKVEVTGTWQLGATLCDMWISCDVMLCTASILNLCCISVDRYFAITDPLVYATKRSKRLALAMIAAVWICAGIVTCPPIFGWQEEGRRGGALAVGRCHLTKDPGYIVYSSLGSFYIPLTIMIFVYARIFHVTRRRNKMLKPYCTTFVFDKQRGFKRWRHRRAKSGGGVASGATETISGVDNDGSNRTPGGALTGQRLPTSGTHARRPDYNRADACDSESDDNFTSASVFDTPTNDRMCEAHPLRILRSAASSETSDDDDDDDEAPPNAHQGRGDRLPTAHAHVKHDVLVTCDAGSHAVSANPERDYFLRREEKRRERAALRRESKTAKTLAVVVGCFIVCWLPFFLVYVIEPFCATCTIDPSTTALVTWLGYCNSVLNPLIYAFYNRDFRMAFWNLTFGLCFR